MSWRFLTNHARALLRIARDPGVRFRDIAASTGITDRGAYGIVTDLTAAGYVVKQKDGRRNRYQIEAHLPLPEPASQEPRHRRVLALLAGVGARLQLTGPDQPEATAPERACAPRQTAGAGQPGPPHRPAVRDGPGHRRPSRPGPFLKRTEAPMPSTR